MSLRDNPLSEQFAGELPTFSAREKAFFVEAFVCCRGG